MLPPNEGLRDADQAAVVMTPPQKLSLTSLPKKGKFDPLRRKRKGGIKWKTNLRPPYMLPPDEDLRDVDQAPPHEVPQLLAVRQVYADVTLVHGDAEAVEDLTHRRALLERFAHLLGWLPFSRVDIVMFARLWLHQEMEILTHCCAFLKRLAHLLGWNTGCVFEG